MRLLKTTKNGVVKYYINGRRCTRQAYDDAWYEANRRQSLNSNVSITRHGTQYVYWET